MLPHMNGLFKSEPLHKLHLYISKMLWGTVISYLSSDTIFDQSGTKCRLMEATETCTKGRALWVQCLSYSSSKCWQRTRAEVEFSRSDTSSELNVR